MTLAEIEIGVESLEAMPVHKLRQKLPRECITTLWLEIKEGKWTREQWDEKCLPLRYRLNDLTAKLYKD